jgi:3-hydroxyacyl-CoA dehydrogenase/enoyl-CoA hydratase/carnithine racemase
MTKIFNMTIDKSGIATVTFDVVGDKMNTWTEEAFLDFDALMREIEASRTIRGILFISGKPDNFLAGANLKVLSEVKSADEARQMVEIFHASFARLEALPFPSVAAINGPCLGGGLEFALVCTARMAQDGKNTIIGLPECSVGLFPGGGGTQRLPRLIGYGAIELILRGTMLPAAKAYEMRIIDRLIPADAKLLESARAFLEDVISGNAEIKRPLQDFSQIDAIAELGRDGIMKITKGREIPAPLLALETMREGLKVSLEEGLAIERKNFVEVLMTKEAKGSINTFFLKTMTDKPRTMMSKGFIPKELNSAAVLGFGTMGRGIVIDILRHTKLPVIVKDIPEALAPGRDFVKKTLEGMAEKRRLREPVDSVMSRLTAVADYGDAFREVDLVIEAVFEAMDVKRQVYQELGEIVRDDCIIASNTSSIPINAMAPFVANASRFAGLHFFSPVWLMQLVEVIRGDSTALNTMDNLLNFAAMIKKRPVVCRDNAGFVVNAILSPYFSNAFKYLEEGNSIEEIDSAMTRFGMPVGPIRLTDEVGIDIPYKVFVGMGVTQQSLKNVVESGRLGLKKSGKGFFLKDQRVDPEVLPFIAKRPPQPRSQEEMQAGFITEMVKIGKDLLDRGVVDDVRAIDVGMIWGIGFPPEKGGLMKWSDLTGLSRQLFGRDFYRE